MYLFMQFSILFTFCEFRVSKVGTALTTVEVTLTWHYEQLMMVVYGEDEDDRDEDWRDEDNWNGWYHDCEQCSL